MIFSVVLALGILTLIRPSPASWLYDLSYRRNTGWLKLTENEYDRYRRSFARVTPYALVVIGIVGTVGGLADLLN